MRNFQSSPKKTYLKAQGQNKHFLFQAKNVSIFPTIPWISGTNSFFILQSKLCVHAGIYSEGIFGKHYKC